MKKILIALLIASFAPAARANPPAIPPSPASIGDYLPGGTPGNCLYVATGPTLGQQSCGSASIAIGSAITSSTAGYGLYVGTAGNAGLLEQFAYGTNVFAALGNALNGASGLVGYSGQLGTPTQGVLTNATGLPAATGIANGALPSGVTINNANWSGTALANANLANPATTVNSQTCTLGSTCTVAAAAGTLTGTTLASGVTASSLTSLGTIGTGTWQGSIIGPTYGGTGVNNGSKTLTLGGSLTTTGAATPTLAFGATGYTYTFPAATDTVAVLGTPQTLTGTQTLNGTSSTIAEILANAAEPATINASAISSPLAYYFNSQSVYWSTANQTANWTVNFAFSSGTSLNTAMATGQTMTAVLCALQGGTAYYNNVVQIDGSSLTSGTNLFWQGGTAPSAGNASGYDCYSYVITKTGSATYIVLATQSQF